MFSPTLRVTKSATTHPERGGARPFTDECRRESDVFDEDRRTFLRRCAVYFSAVSVPPGIRIGEAAATATAIMQMAKMLAEAG